MLDRSHPWSMSTVAVRVSVPAIAALALVVVVATPSAVPQELFEAVDRGPLVEYRGSSRGAAWGDFDGDGDADLFVTHPTYDGAPQRNALFRNDRGQLVPVPWTAPSRPPDGWEGAAWIDVDDDGDLDLHLVGRSGTGSEFFENLGDGVLTRRTPDPFGDRVSSASMTCWADADRDGRLDGFVTGYDTEGNRLFRNLGAWSFEEVPLPDHGQGDGSSRSCTWADLDSDHLPEMVVANARRPNVLLRNRGRMVFEADTTTALHQDVAYSYGLSAVDANGDGRRDVFVANFDAGNALLLGREDGGLELVDLGAALQSPASKGHAWGDYDLDGRLDLYLGSGTPAPGMVNRLYLGLGGGRYRPWTEGVVSAHADTSAAVAAADYDLDGDLDLFVANWGGPGSVDRLYSNTTSGRRWLQVRLEGVRSNRMGVGARASVRVTDDDGSRWIHRWLDAATGYAGQNEPVLHFGLGAVARVDSLVVLWPSGVTDRRSDLPADARMTVREGG